MLIDARFGGSHLQLLVELQDITPRIWRRLVVPVDTTLDVLHDILQIAFGWKNCHLHSFEVGDVLFMLPDRENEILSVDEGAAPLGAVAPQPGSTFVYLYDFGDDWRHEIKVEKLGNLAPGAPFVRCVDGARACPPEDCGGATGYENLVRVLSNPKDEEYADMRRWAGRAFDPEKLELEKINKKMDVIGRRLQKSMRLRRP